MIHQHHSQQETCLYWLQVGRADLARAQGEANEQSSADLVDTEPAVAAEERTLASAMVHTAMCKERCLPG